MILLGKNHSSTRTYKPVHLTCYSWKWLQSYLILLLNKANRITGSFTPVRKYIHINMRWKQNTQLRTNLSSWELMMRWCSFDAWACVLDCTAYKGQFPLQLENTLYKWIHSQTICFWKFDQPDKWKYLLITKFTRAM